MEKIIMLGTGHGATLDLFNTCFVIQNEKGNFLVDTGGGIEVINRLNKVKIDFKTIKHIFISHSHTDHILGIFWLFKRMVGEFMQGMKEKINVYCNDVVFHSIIEVSKLILPAKLVDRFNDNLNFVALNDGDTHKICGVSYTFFDVLARGTKLFGFECSLNKKKLAFLGDETLNPKLYERVTNFDYVMHEAFCLDSEEKIFHAYEKNHSTTKSVAEVMNKLNVKNLILYHTEDSHGEKRKMLYTKEAQKYFKGKVIVPNELETIEIN